MKKLKILSNIFLAFCLFFPALAMARENVDYWYIKDFYSQINVNKDSSLDITERIVADCGNAVGKHGIFRILPTQIKTTDGRTIDNPVELFSITDLDYRPLKYTETRDIFNHTITWKIGDPDIIVHGENDYIIKYKVKNAIRFGNAGFDELYWNLSGNFWDIPIDSFGAEINFPEEVGLKNAKVDLYTGSLGSKDKSLADYSWLSQNILKFSSTGILEPGQGITASIVFPKNIFIPYQAALADKFSWAFDIRFFTPIFVFIICFIAWFIYGKDPRPDKPVIAEYGPPKNLSPIELGVLYTNGRLKKEFITAEIINFAVKGIITIRETKNDFLFFHSKTYELIRVKNIKLEDSLNPAQRIIFGNLFNNGDEVKLLELKNSFYKCLKEVEKAATESLEKQGLIIESSIRLRRIFQIIGTVIFFSSLFIFGRIFNDFLVTIALSISGIIILIFGFFMPKRTIQGAELKQGVDRFKLYMKTAEKYRSQFQEKENIFEKLLPYAVVFGITGLWVKKMQEIYGADFYAHYAPIWFAGNIGAFDINSLNSTISSLSSGIAANISAPSGSGGAGGAGGGGGGGGGGGW